MNEPPWYHRMWLTPLLVLVLAYQWMLAMSSASYHRARMRYILWRNPALKDLMKLAGNNKP